MRIKLDDHNMDLVMNIVRSNRIKIEEAVNFLLNNPEIILNTRGVQNVKNGEKKACKRGKEIINAEV